AGDPRPGRPSMTHYGAVPAWITSAVRGDPSQRLQERDEGIAVGLGERAVSLLRLLGFAAMPEHRLGEPARTAVVEIILVAAGPRHEADAPKRRRPPKTACEPLLLEGVGEPVAHVVKQEIGEGMDRLVR